MILCNFRVRLQWTFKIITLGSVYKRLKEKEPHSGKDIKIISKLGPVITEILNVCTVL